MHVVLREDEVMDVVLYREECFRICNICLQASPSPLISLVERRHGLHSILIQKAEILYNGVAP